MRNNVHLLSGVRCERYPGEEAAYKIVSLAPSVSLESNSYLVYVNVR